MGAVLGAVLGPRAGDRRRVGEGARLVRFASRPARAVVVHLASRRDRASVRDNRSELTDGVSELRHLDFEVGVDLKLSADEQQSESHQATQEDESLGRGDGRGWRRGGRREARAARTKMRGQSRQWIVSGVARRRRMRRKHPRTLEARRASPRDNSFEPRKPARKLDEEDSSRVNCFLPATNSRGFRESFELAEARHSRRARGGDHVVAVSAEQLWRGRRRRASRRQRRRPNAWTQRVAQHPGCRSADIQSLPRRLASAGRSHPASRGGRGVERGHLRPYPPHR